MRAPTLAAALVLLAAAHAALAPAASAACEESITLRSARPPLTWDAPLAGATAGACLRVAGTEVTDDRHMMPEATHVAAAYHVDWGAAHPQLVAQLDGLGFANATFAMNRTASLSGSDVYRMPLVPIPGGAGASGTLRVTVFPPAGGSVSKAYETTL